MKRKPRRTRRSTPPAVEIAAEPLCAALSLYATLSASMSKVEASVRRFGRRAKDCTVIYAAALAQSWQSVRIRLPAALNVFAPMIPLAEAAALMKEAIERSGLDEASLSGGECMDYREVVLSLCDPYTPEPPSRVARRDYCNRELSPEYARAALVRPGDLRTAIKTYLDALKAYQTGI